MNKTNLLWGLTMLLCPMSAMAEQLNLQQAIDRIQSDTQGAAARRTPAFLQQSNLTSHYRLAMTAQTEAGDKNLFYVVNTLHPTNGEEQSFLILSADDLAPALLAYGDTPFHTDSLPANVQYWLDNYKEAIHHAIETGKPIVAGATSATIIEKLIRTKWSQSGSYVLVAQNQVNAALEAAGVPTFDTYTGCVATAAAQVMNYYQYPAQGTGSHSYCFYVEKESVTTTGADTTLYIPITMSADFSTSTYDWAHMADNYDYQYYENGNHTYTDNSLQEKLAVAQLMYDCGVAVEMSYGADGSGAYTEKWCEALPAYFNYDKAIHQEYRTFYTQDEWEIMIYNELAAKRPVIYSGRNASGGHAFLCDGYDGAGHFHINWGWNGKGDGYYTLIGNEALSPHDDEGGYVNAQQIICGIQPDKGNSFAPDKIANRDGYSLSIYMDQMWTTPLPQETYPISYILLKGGFYNVGNRPIDVRLGAKFVKVDDPSVVVYEPCTYKEDTFEVGDGYYSYYVRPYSIPQDGTYYVYPVWMYKEDNANDETLWRDVLRPIEMTQAPYITLQREEFYTMKKYVNGVGYEKIVEGKAYPMAGEVFYDCNAKAIVTDEYEMLRLGLKYVLVDDPSIYFIEPSRYNYYPDYQGSYLYRINGNTYSIPQVGTYKVYPVWADFEADYCDYANWHDIELYQEEVPTIAFRECALLRNYKQPVITVKKSGTQYNAHITLGVQAYNNFSSAINILIYLYGNSPEDPYRYTYINSYVKTVSRVQKGQKIDCKELRINTTTLTKDRGYLINVRYSYTPAGQSQTIMTLGPDLTSSFSVPDDTSELDEIAIDEKEAELPTYNLQGQRVGRAPKSGLYVSQGKKVLIK